MLRSLVGSEMCIRDSIDSLSDIARMHSLKVGISLLLFVRLQTSYVNDNTNVKIGMGYRISPSTLANGGSALTILKQAALSRPLVSSLAIPPHSVWRYIVQSARVIDLDTMDVVSVESVVGFGITASTSPKMGVLQLEGSEQIWSTSTRVNPLQFGTRLNATHINYKPSEQLADAANTYSMARVAAGIVTSLRTRIGFVVLLNDDKSIPYITLLQDMLATEIEDEFVESERAASDGTTPQVTVSHVPDVLYQTGGTAFTTPQAIDITATYVSANGSHTTRTRQVVVAEMVGSSTASIDLSLNRTAIAAAVNKPGGTVLPTSLLNAYASKSFNTALTDSQKDSYYYGDQAELLTYSRQAIANDRVIGTISNPLPVLVSGPASFTCFAGECAQGTLITRAIQWKLNADIGFVSALTPVASPGYPAGNISLADAFRIFPWPNVPCKAVFTGLRIWRLVESTVSQSKFTTDPTATGDSLLLQMAGIKIEYAIQTTGFAKVVNILIYNATTAAYQQLDRLRYYTVAATDYQCLYQPIISSLFSTSSLYRGESVQGVFSQQPIQEVIAAYLSSTSPYTPTYTNYYVEVPLSQLTSGARSYLTYNTGLASCASTQWYDAGVATCFDCPSGFERSAGNVTQCVEIPIPADNKPLIIGLAVGGSLLLIGIVAVAVMCEYRRRSGSRSNSNAPRGTSDVAVIFTDIKSSTRMWGAAPMSMGVSLDAHHSIIRECIGEQRGYEVKTVGDSFMIVVEGAQRGLDLAVSIQHKLHNHKWPSAIDDAYDSNFEDFDIVDDPEDVYGPEDGAPWNGLRVRIGVHYGPVEVILDAVTKGYDYYGPTVNVAARVEGVTDGGQVCVTAALMAAVQPTTDTYQSVLLAKTTLRGVKDEMEVYEIRPAGIVGRKFNNPLIFDEEAKAAMILDAADTSMSTMNTHGTGISHVSQTYTPLTTATRPIRDSIREAFKALRGSDRVQLLEKLRKAWRVDLPSGKSFTGLSAEQMAEKQRRVAKGGPRGRRGRKRTGSRGQSQSSGTVHSRKMASISSLGDTNASKTTLGSGHSDTEEEEEDDEDIIFRSVAQRVAPAMKALAKSSSTIPRLSVHSGTRAESITETDAADYLRSISKSEGRPPSYSPNSSHSWRGQATVVPGGAQSNSSATNIAHLIDIQSFKGSGSVS
eukprot:TRINITY_DN2346_c0_g1_i3.p1 TRINITY_DN2346_c0_g1~~TRINITY_DN2346_c0_g1_i3.p1  ORF type:complete len:1208 (+),score=288.29 TRINITY_DN2346_c0_g1_i3:133-3624(+)